MRALDALAVVLIAVALVLYLRWALRRTRRPAPRWQRRVDTERDGTVVVSVRARGRNARVIARIPADMPEPEFSQRAFAAESEADEQAAALNHLDRR